MTAPAFMIALVRLEHHAFGSVWVVERCPYCGEEHRHGGGGRDDDPRSFLFHRVPHCALQELPPGIDPSPGYVLREAP
jgi:hypothetical protein